MWRACAADDDVRRDGVGLDHDDDALARGLGARPLARHRGLRRQRRPAAVPAPLPARRARRRSPPVRHLDGVFYQADVWLDGAYLGDPEGYFFPHTLRHHRPVPPGHRARAGHRGRRARRSGNAPPSATSPARSSTATCSTRRGTPAGCGDRCASRTPAPVRIDRLRVLCRDANDARAHLRLHARLDADRQRSVVVRTSVDGEVVAEQSRSLAAGLNEVDWNLDVERPGAVVAVEPGRPAPHRRRGRGPRRRTCPATRGRCAPVCARWRCTTGCSRSTASGCS